MCVTYEGLLYKDMYVCVTYEGLLYKDMCVLPMRDSSTLLDSLGLAILWTDLLDLSTYSGIDSHLHKLVQQSAIRAICFSSAISHQGVLF